MNTKPLKHSEKYHDVVLDLKVEHKTLKQKVQQVQPSKCYKRKEIKK
jgi:hypothetical protein